MKKFFLIIAALFLTFTASMVFAATKCEIPVPTRFSNKVAQSLVSAGYSVTLIPQADMGWTNFEDFSNKYVSEGQYVFTYSWWASKLANLNLANEFTLYQKKEGRMQLIASYTSHKMNLTQLMEQYLPKCADLQ